MMKRLILALALTIQPALAVNTATGTGLTPLIVFRSHAARTTEIDVAPATNFTNANDDVYDFIPVSNDTNPADYLNTGSTYSLSPPVLVAPAPPVNIAGFQQAVAQDPCIPVPALLQFCAYAGVINATTAQTLPVTQTLWAKAKAVDAQISGPFSGMCLDDPSTPTINESLIPITTRLETISDLYNCQLNPAN